MESRRSILKSLAGVAALAGAPGIARAAETDFATWLAGVRKEAIASGLRPQSVDRALKGVSPIPRVLELDQHQPETALTFEEYIERVANPQRIATGRNRLAENRALLDEVTRRFHVQPRFIVSLWGIETNYGDQIGNFSVIAALATLAYDGRRSAFFRSELMSALKIVDQGYIKPEEMIGSWAGAMGQSQFLPSSYLHYAVSFRGDGKRDIWHRREDVFASIANYLAQQGWHGNETWGCRVQVPPGFDANLAGMPTRKALGEWQRLGVRRLGGINLPAGDIPASLLLPSGVEGPALLAYDNFRTIMKWNSSTYFAAAVGYLADEFESA